MASLPPLSKKIVKRELPEEVAARLRGAIVSGDLPPGLRLVEQDIAARLGVSRTPVRQAFFALQDEGLISPCGARGLAVSALNADEITNLYQLIAALERAALLHTPSVSASMMAKLAAANRLLGSAGHHLSRIIQADFAWHRALTGTATNQLVKAMLEPLRLRSERYERAFFRANPNLARAIADHTRIETLLKAGDIAEVAHAIEAHWLDAITPMRVAIRAKSDELGC